MDQISLEAVENIYHLSRQVYLGEITQEDALQKTSTFGGMSEASANAFINNLGHMLNGQRYVRTLSIEATDHFLRRIFDDFGSASFSKAVRATKAHLEYYASLPKGGAQPTKTQLIVRLEKEYSGKGRQASMMRRQYYQHINEQNIEGSNKASSYIRALELLDGILKRDNLFELRDFWSLDQADEIEKLYQHALLFQKKEGSEFLQPDLPPSYGRNGYYSAALKSYKEFLILNRHENRLWDLYNEPDVEPAELSKRIDAEEVESIESLIENRELDFSTKEGKEVLRETKARVNQDFFRKMLLDTYDTQCCVTGLNFPAVLRASHIVGWAEDKDNRMNPENGLCLSATYDAAFDRHLISFDEDYRMIFSSDLKEYYSNEAFKTQFVVFEGQPISKPKRFCPDQEFLQKHREKMPA